jgi:hypothetical protein
MKSDIDCLKNLDPAQLQNLRVWIENLGYRKAAERASEEFQRPIHKAALQRFIWRTAPADFLENTPDNDEATRQILKFGADGKADFTASTVGTLEQLAFQLSLTCTAIDDDMNALGKLSTMLSRFRNSAVRERMAVVQEGKKANSNCASNNSKRAATMTPIPKSRNSPPKSPPPSASTPCSPLSATPNPQRWVGQAPRCPGGRLARRGTSTAHRNWKCTSKK